MYQSITMAKPHVEYKTHKKIEAEKNGGKDGKALYQLLNNDLYCKTMETKTCKQRKRLFKWTSKPRYNS